MNLIEWSPFREIDNMGREMVNFLEKSPLRIMSPNLPKVDVYQTETDVVVKAEIPGASKEDLNLFVDENSIRLSGQTRQTDEFRDENIYRSERYFGSFSRTIPLPVSIKTDQAQAEYTDGILSVRVPKVEPSTIKGKKVEIP